MHPATDAEPPFRKFWNQAKGTIPDIVGEADLSTLNSALDFLFSRLRVAQEQFYREGDNGRRGAFTALAASWMFITAFRTPFNEELYVPILRLQDALVMLDKKLVEPILRPVRRSGRGPSSYTYACLKGYAAAAVELLLQQGLARADAYLAVATQLSELGVRPGRGSGAVTATTVRNWYDEVSSDVGRHGIAAVMFDKKLLSNKGADRTQTLQKLAAWVLALFPELQKPRYACLKGYAAVAVELLLQQGLARADAHLAVATQLSELGVRPGRSSWAITATMVRNWYDEVSSDVGRHSIAAGMFDKKLLSNKGADRTQTLQKLAAWVLALFPELQKPS